MTSEWFHSFQNVAFSHWSTFNSRSLFTAIDVLRDRLAIVIMEGRVQPDVINESISTLSDLDLPQAANIQEACISWLRRILDSGYPEDTRYLMASTVVIYFEKQLSSPSATRLDRIYSAALRPLLDFFLLGERFHHTESPPYPTTIALRMLVIGTHWGYFNLAILPALTSALLPTHPLQLRRLALQLFQRPGFRWTSPQAEAFSSVERARLLEAIGDPFECIPHLPPHNGQLLKVTTDYNPELSMALLIGFAGSDIWRDHLHPSNFTSSEEAASTEEGRGRVFQCMFEQILKTGTGPLYSATKFISALRCLEGMECWNTAEVVILWTWTHWFVDATDHDAWEVIGHETLKFYRARGKDRLGGLSRHIKDHLGEGILLSGLLRTRDQNTSCRVVGVRKPVRIHAGWRRLSWISREDMSKISLTCQLRRLYHLFGFGPTTWEEAIAAGKPDKETSGGSDLEGEGPSILSPVNFSDFACDYP